MSQAAPHLRLVPPAPPQEAVAHLTWLIGNATRTFGAHSGIVSELKGMLAAAKVRAGN